MLRRFEAKSPPSADDSIEVRGGTSVANPARFDELQKNGGNHEIAKVTVGTKSI